MDRISAFNSTISLGPLTVPVVLLTAAAAAGVGYLIFALLMKDAKEQRKRAGAALINAAIIFFVVWKLSPLIFRFQSVVSAPVLLIYSSGGPAGTALAAAAALTYLIVRGLRARRQGQFALRHLLRPAAGGLAAAGITVAALVVLFQFILSPSAAGSETAAETGTAIGMHAPDIPLIPLGTAGETDGGGMLSDYRGTTVFLNFWATWCPPCRAEIPEMEEFVQTTRAEGTSAAVLAVNLTSTERDREAVREFVRERGLSFPVFLDPDGTAAAVYGVQAVPTTYVISPEGIIRAKKTGVMSRAWMLRQLGD